jgi:hypothetical protein
MPTPIPPNQAGQPQPGGNPSNPVTPTYPLPPPPAPQTLTLAQVACLTPKQVG